MEDADLAALGRSSRRDRSSSSIAPRHVEPAMEHVPRTHSRSHSGNKKVSFDTDAETGTGSLTAKMRSNPLYAPVVFVLLGAVLAAGFCYWYVAPQEDADGKTKSQCRKDMQERALMSGAVGGVLGFIGYRYLFAPAAVDDDEDGLDDSL